MNMFVETGDDRVTCFLSGRLDTLVSMELEPQIDRITDQTRKLVFNFADVGYISSSFLRICLKKYKEHGGNNFWIEAPIPDIKKVFKIAGLERLIRE